MSFGLLAQKDQAVQWRGPMASKGITQMCFDVDWGELDWLVFDLPPGTGDVQMTLFEKVHFDAVIIVTTAQNLALIDTQRSIHLLAHKDLPILGMIENMAYHSCKKCGEKDFLFGSISSQDFLRDHGYEKLAAIPFDHTLAQCQGVLDFTKIPKEVLDSLNQALTRLKP